MQNQPSGFSVFPIYLDTLILDIKRIFFLQRVFDTKIK